MSFIELQKEFGGRIKQLREEQGLSQEKLAEKAEISWRYLIDIEHGRYGPSFRKLYSLAQALNVEVKDLFTFDQPPQNT